MARAFGLFFGFGLMTICVGCFFYALAKYGGWWLWAVLGALLLVTLLLTAGFNNLQ